MGKNRRVKEENGYTGWLKGFLIGWNFVMKQGLLTKKELSCVRIETKPLHPI